MTCPKRGKGGPTNGYTNHGCRCEECRAAWTEYCLDRREERFANGIPRRLHGKYTTYQNYKCRCRKCRAAWSEKVREWYHARKARVA